MRQTVNLNVVGSIPTCGAKIYLGVAQPVKSARLGSERSKVQILSPRPDYNTVLQLEMQLSRSNTRVEPKQKDQHGSLIA